MKYFNIKSIMKSIERIVLGDVSQEHRTGTAGTELARLYFPQGKFTITPEQFQVITGKKPDLAIEKYREISDTLEPHTFIEFKSLVNSNMPNIVEQLYNTLSEALDLYGNQTGNFSVFLIGIKGTKLAFYMFHNFDSLLCENHITNYKGIIPLTELISKKQFISINGDDFLGSRYRNNINFITDNFTLRSMGVLSSPQINHPQIFDLLNLQHREQIHLLFEFLAKSDANLLFVD